MKAKRSVYNLIAAIISQAVTMILGLIVPRLTLVNFGSEVNGYMTMVNQVYAYIALLEAGLGTAVVQALYGPVANEDKNNISAIVNAARGYYKKIAGYYAAAVASASVIIPLLIDTSLSKVEMMLYFLLFGVSNVVNFCFTAAMRPLLLAEGKNYVTSYIAMVFHIASQTVKIVFLMIGTNIVTLQLMYSIVNVLQILVYFLYFKKCYRWLDKKVPANEGAIKQRNAFFMQQISNLVFSCTDVMLLSFFCDLKAASVYAVYMLVFNSLSAVLSMVASSTQFVLGQTYNSNRNNYIFVHRTYESGLLTFSFTLFSVAELLTISFVKLYTRGVSDINYIDVVLPVLFCTNGLLATCKSTSLCLINFSYHATQTMKRTFFEAGLNLCISVALVPFWGIRGVLLGTAVALFYRVIDMTIYTNHVILKTSAKDSIILYASNFVIFILVVAVSILIPIHLQNWGQFFAAGMVCTFVCGIFFCVVNVIINPALYKNLFAFLRKKLSP